MAMFSLDRALSLVAGNFSEKSAILAVTSTMTDSFDTMNTTNVTNSSSSIEPPSATHKIEWIDLVLALLLCVLIVVS